MAREVTATEIAGNQGGGLAAGQLVVWLLSAFYGVDVPPEIAIALGTLLGGAGLIARRVWHRFFAKDWKHEIDDIDFDAQ